nr:hypothetical protein [uncultured Actinomyces sp.]
MNLPKKLTSLREALPILLRCLAIALAVALVSALAVSASWLMHRPVGYSGNARVSSFISPDFASGFDVAWEMTSAELGTDAPVREIVNVDGTAVIFASSLASSDDPLSGTLIGIDASGRTPTVLWRHDIHNGNMNLLIWEDSIVAGDETIRAADGAVTATWETPLPTTLRFSYYADKAVPATLVGNFRPIREGSRFVQVTWPVALVCAPTDTEHLYNGPTTEFTCTAWHKDGSQAWSYVTSTEEDHQRGPINTPAVDGHILVGHYSDYRRYDGDGFLNLADGTYTRGDTQDGINATMLFPASDGWIYTASSGPSWQDQEFVVYNPDGTERERTARSVGSRDWLRILHMTCWDTTGHIITPTAEQALETLRSEKVSWAPLCTQPPTYSETDIGFINGRPLMTTNKDGSPKTDSYPDDSILASDGSLLLYPSSTWTDDTSRQAVSLSQPLYSAPEGVLLSNLTEVGAYGATPLYDDLLIAEPNHPDSSWHRYLGTYPHSDTVLMGITPKRAG